ncbi:YggS family pyridoxal phosphate-dependent enzyme [Aliidiomarina sp. B3213]|uniref:YggS family pyridoxal phosphate-dependent enzyme n=1 Tax=Aliidiomarina sp. B3213 TaxID=2249757 RepID=UPI000DD010A7|nr:YggS family pyridoxal phosphate-dependent enzyme [Aliidiomarina sp. B3213]RTE87823.1 YggS family pyridoxal phosphate-dependent enzyme [Aliidiomarina sp. B3213]TCZ93403.1 YggS family pyridoxal phosphate-dependent enzyme [Lysobacter sp. N42]
MATIAEHLEKVRARINQAAQNAQRNPSDIRLLAVSKTKPASDIEAAYESQQRAFGENYVQEGADKVAQLSALNDIEWHFIGPLQSNKTRIVAESFDWVQSIDRLKIARRLNEQRPPESEPLQVLIQVNIDDESSKSGVKAEDVLQFANDMREFKSLNLRGLMAIPKANPSEQEQERTLSSLHKLFEELKQHFPQVDTLSVGMSSDLEAAILHGSTMVRVGTDIFGARNS